MAKSLKSEGFDMDGFLGSTESDEGPQRVRTGSVPDPIRGHTGSAPVRERRVRMSDEDWEWLRAHFEAKGIAVSAGLRMIVREYMDRH